jgi:UDP-N-acetylglucosamine 4,6-dehydratase
MISEDDARQTIEHDDYYAILPAIHPWDTQKYITENGGRPCPSGFCYSSDKNTQWLSVDELREIIGNQNEKNDVPAGD